VIVLGLQGVSLLLATRNQGTTVATGAADLPAEPSRELALKLEKQGLNQAAAGAWETYLNVADADAEKAARIWYRIGTLRQDAGDFEQALAAFYRSEAHAKTADIADDLGNRVQECLEALGKFAALRYELAQRVGINPDEKATGDVVVAEIGPRKITQSDLDRQIEQMVDHQLQQFAAQLTPEQLRQQKEAIIARLGNSGQRQQILQKYLADQMLYLKAREDKLQDDPNVRAALLDAERQTLAGEAMRRALADRIHITPGDVQTYYTAHQAEFVDPAQATVRHILLPDEEQAKAAINSLKAGQDFAELAKTASTDAATADKGGKLPGAVTQGDGSLPGIGQAPELAKAIFAAKAGDLLPTPYQTARGWHVVQIDSLRPAKQLSFEEARDRAYQQLQSQKQQEVQQALFEELRTRFNVVVHRDQFAPQQPEGTPAP
jgi:peptidyl-prolyl cis-trans isomerase C